MRISSLILALVVWGGLLPGALRADEIILKNGSRFKGRVLKEGDGKITFECDAGVITLRASKVKQIKRGPWLREAKPAVSKPRVTRSAKGRSQRRRASPG